ncbi:MAG TPA: CPBP family intramembrane glutamic endopeptidase [Candidatus Angelobacter sp.]|nr:CPBP family intramembrane glutamic endopeptidase [Candidatus Angelobacter sp.]
MISWAIYAFGLTIFSHPPGYSSVSQYLFGGGVFVTTIIYQCINPFFEELIVRAYVMTQVRQLTNSAVIAVIASTLLQTSYHFYQGVPLALAEGGAFFVFCLYYAKTKRITPIILAHLYSDVVPSMLYVVRHWQR